MNQDQQPAADANPAQDVPAAADNQGAPGGGILQQLLADNHDPHAMHPHFLPQDGVDPADLPPYPDVRPGWDTPYTEAEARDCYATPDVFVKRWGEAPENKLDYRDRLRLQMDILERNIRHWDPSTAAIGKQVLEMKNHSGIMGNPQLMDIKPTNRGQLQPFDAEYLAKLIDPVEGMFYRDILGHCARTFITQTGRTDLSTWDRKHFEETLAAFYWKNGENEKLYPVYPPQHLIGLGILPHNMGNPEYEKNGFVMVRNRAEEIAAWNRWFEEFMRGEPEEEEIEEFDAVEAYMELLTKDKGLEGAKGTTELMKLVERKKKKGKTLCLSF